MKNKKIIILSIILLFVVVGLLIIAFIHNRQQREVNNTYEMNMSENVNDTVRLIDGGYVKGFEYKRYKYILNTDDKSIDTSLLYHLDELNVEWDTATYMLLEEHTSNAILSKIRNTYPDYTGGVAYYIHTVNDQYYYLIDYNGKPVLLGYETI